MAQDRSLPPMSALQAFYAAGLAGSFQEAARTLAVTPSAISHQVRALEHWLGKPLFVRTARQVRLTREGHAFLKVIGRSFGHIRTAAERIRVSETKAATVRISALPLFTSVWLIPRLEVFERDHPDIVLEIDTTNRIVDFSDERVDLAIRFVTRPAVGLEYRKLLDVRPVPICTPRLCDQLGVPSDLARQTLIHVSTMPDSWPRWLEAVGCAELRAKRDLTFDSVPASLEAAARGRGVAMAMDPIVWDAPIAGGLVRAFPHRVAGIASYYLAYRKADLARPNVRACVDWFLAEMARYKRGRLQKRNLDQDGA
jgi:LysR family transcriptional regulator, glycine cleavage system transcriptional activator